MQFYDPNLHKKSTLLAGSLKIYCLKTYTKNLYYVTFYVSLFILIQSLKFLCESIPRQSALIIFIQGTEVLESDNQDGIQYLLFVK